MNFRLRKRMTILTMPQNVFTLKEKCTQLKWKIKKTVRGSAHLFQFPPFAKKCALCRMNKQLCKALSFTSIRTMNNKRIAMLMWDESTAGADAIRLRPSGALAHVYRVAACPHSLACIYHLAVISPASRPTRQCIVLICFNKQRRVHIARVA